MACKSIIFMFTFSLKKLTTVFTEDIEVEVNGLPMDTGL